MSVCLIEKGPQIGAHILSGNVFQPKGLDELLPNWKELGVICLFCVTFTGSITDSSNWGQILNSLWKTPHWYSEPVASEGGTQRRKLYH